MSAPAGRNTVALGWRQRLEAFESFAERLDYPDATAYRSERMKGIESIAHEMAHVVVLNLSLSGKHLGAAINERHAKMSPESSDKSEINTLAVEWLALRALGMRVSMRRLAEYAASEMRTERYRKRWTRIERAALTQTRNPWVRGRATRMVQLVMERVA